MKHRQSNKKSSARSDEQPNYQCEDWYDDGRGAILFQGKRVPVAGLIPGEVAAVKLKRGAQGIAYEGVIERIVTPSKLRVKPACRHFGPCGACHLQHLSAKGQMQFKQAIAERHLAPFGQVAPILAMPSPWHYRNKSHFTFSENGPGKVTSGLYQEGSHKVVPIENCLVQPPNVDAIANTLRQLVKSFRLEVYNEDSQRGLVRHVLVRQGFVTGEIMVVIVVAKMQVPSKRNFLNALLKAHPEIKTVLLNQNNQRTSMVLGQNFECLYGPGFIREITNGLTFEIGPSTFYQINPRQTEQLFKLAIEKADLKGHEVVIDAYCGVGTLGLFASKYAKQVFGVESNRESVMAAQKNAKLNSISNVKFIASDAGQWMRQCADAQRKIDVVIMDPPRSGADQVFLSSLVHLMPQKIIYVSCNVETQARDIKYLAEHGYKILMMQPVDMFPQSFHIENICLLERS